MLFLIMLLSFSFSNNKKHLYNGHPKTPLRKHFSLGTSALLSVLAATSVLPAVVRLWAQKASKAPTNQ